MFSRYIFGRRSPGSRIGAYAFIWVVFVGAGVGMKEGRHILIATFGSHLPPRFGAALRMLVWLLVMTTLWC